MVVKAYGTNSKKTFRTEQSFESKSNVTCQHTMYSIKSRPSEYSIWAFSKNNYLLIGEGQRMKYQN